MQGNRRIFLVSAALLGQVCLVEPIAAAVKIVDPSDPQATVLGYTPDANDVPPAFARKHVAGAHCGNCALFQGHVEDSPGPCPLFGGRDVQSKGWCGSWVAKAS